ncbi:MAG: 16S rRNA (guanine(527)-N(7))-methyltransferase RsmG [Candidatus Saganbacteria bacterium]|nr:16S rRNA (guanine(527)-N(7))-methyltransferase RsmG [Candidatus Saganbacteria bacterium]
MDGRDKKFDLLLKTLLAWNKKFNLTAITRPEDIWLKHFDDSLALLNFYQLTNQKVIDIGSGAGFPGLPLKIACPDIKLTLVEATAKKVEFLNHVAALLAFNDVRVIHGRAEDLGHELRESFDLAVSRAVAELKILSELCLPFVKVGGQFVAYKEAKVEDEVMAAQTAIETMGGKFREIRKYNLGKNGLVRSFVVIDKIAPTPEKYPRRPGMPKKKPLQ